MVTDSLRGGALLTQQQATGSTLHPQWTPRLLFAVRSARDINSRWVQILGVLSFFPRKMRLFQFCIFNKGPHDRA